MESPVEPSIQREDTMSKAKKPSRTLLASELTEEQKYFRGKFIRALDMMLSRGDCPMGIIYDNQQQHHYGIMWGTNNEQEILRMEDLIHRAFDPANRQSVQSELFSTKVN